MKDLKKWSYQQAKRFMEAAPNGGSCYELTNIRNLMQQLGNVQEQLKVIHVAGTNGKGSVCACIYRILREAGYRTGLYSSPAVFDDEEVIQMNGMQISRQDFAEIAAVVSAACARMKEEGMEHPTAFEIETAIAFYWFYRETCDFVVLEAGMGGAKDATNIISRPVCSVLTSISRDHMAFLGESLTEIAQAKAGIIKPGCPCVTARQEPEVLNVLQNVAENAGSELWAAQERFVRHFTYDRQESRFLLSEELRQSPELRDSGEMADGSEGLRQSPELRDSVEADLAGTIHCALTGDWQHENIVCALTVIRLLQERNILIPLEAVQKGLADVCLPGRFERIHEAPDVYIDGAHNEGAAWSLRATVQNCFTNTKIVYIIGVLADKEYEKVLRLLLPYAAQVFTITPDHPRALDGAALAGEAGRYHENVSYVPSLEQAVKQAADAAGADGVVLAFGSFSYLGKLRQAVKDIL